MKILYTKSKWEMWNDKLIDFIKRLQKDSFDGTELYFDSISNSSKEIKEIHEDFNLFLVGQILTEGETAENHIDSFKRQADFALEAGSNLVNVHAGKDFFSFEENIKILDAILDFSLKVKIRFLIETHRGRMTYSAIDTKRYIEKLSDLKLTADLSHWMVVHESDLSNQIQNLEAAIDRSYHIHARVGYEEGPQVPDPTAPEWEVHLNNHLLIWKKIIDKRKKEGLEFITITPEFGPPNYMHTLPFINEPVRDTWEMNVKMRDILVKKLGK